jgi:hypothetical protein
MKATTNKIDPIEKRMRRGRKIARSATLVVLLAVGVTAMIHPDLFSAQLKMPTEEERENAKKQRKKNQNKKPQRRLSKLDVERLAKLREKRARKHLMEILRRLEERIVIAEKEEAAVTAQFRKDPRLFDSIKDLIVSHTKKFAQAMRKDVGSYTYPFHRSKQPMNSVNRALIIAVSKMSRSLGSTSIQKYAKSTSDDSLDDLIHDFSKMEALLADEKVVKMGFVPEKQTKRYLTSIKENAVAIKSNDRDRAVRGFAQPEDHPLNTSQRSALDRTLSPMSMAQLHQLSQDMATHYTNLMGDVDAGALAEAADIPFPEAVEKLAHQPFAADDMQELLDQEIPESVDGLDQFTDALNEGEISAEEALKKSGGETPMKPGERDPGDQDSKAEEAKPAEAEGDDGNGGGEGSENSSQPGPKSSKGQLTDEQVLRSLALESALGASQNRSREITVDKEKVIANVLPGRRFTADSARKGYLFIDTWHIIGPWEATANPYRKVEFSKVYPLEKKIDLDAIYTTGRTQCRYDDERGYAGRKTMTGRLKWHFYQSPTVEVRIPREQLAHDSLYFAYTEVYFEQDATMHLAIASDDAARIRVNGQLVFEDTGLSPYVISEQVRQVNFKRGINKILVRLVNGPGPCRFSLLLTPKSN